MTETTGIRQHVPTVDYHPTAPSHSRFLQPASGALPYKRKILVPKGYDFERSPICH